MSRRRRERGYTLIELLIVSGVIAIVAAGALSVVAMVTRERVKLEKATERAQAERLKLERAIKQTEPPAQEPESSPPR